MADEQQWRKSSFSSTNGDCVAVNGALDAVRDSKNPDGSVLPVGGFVEFVTDVKSGRFDRQ